MGMFGGPEVSYYQTYSARDWLSILGTPYPTQNLQMKHRTDSQMTTKARKRTIIQLFNSHPVGCQFGNLIFYNINHASS